MFRHRIILLSMTTLLLMGCFERHIFDMPESQFYSLTDEQKQEVIRAYNERQLQRTLNEPINNLVGVAGIALTR